MKQTEKEEVITNIALQYLLSYNQVIHKKSKLTIYNKMNDYDVSYNSYTSRINTA